MNTDTDVLVVGAGPVGLTAANALAHHGVRSTVVDPRTEPDGGSPRCKNLNARTMELYRRIGLAQAIRSGSKIPFGWSDSVVFTTTLMGARIERFDQALLLQDLRTDDLVEPAMWSPQNQTEASLRRALAGQELVSAEFGTRVEGLRQFEDYVLATIVDGNGRARELSARYVIAADGGRSSLRRQLGTAFEGTSDSILNLQVTFHAPDLAAAHPQGRAVQYWVVNPRMSGLLGRLDLEGNWWAIILGAPENPPEGWVESALTLMIGARTPFTISSRDPWVSRMLVAQRYRHGRVLLAGDAAHLNPPWGGFGANTGIGDAVDVAWKLAAVLQGWGGEALLDSYERERRPVAQGVIRAASKNMASLGPVLSHPDLLEEGPRGDSARTFAAAAIRRLKVDEFYTKGFILGTRYADSPAICYDSGPAPESSTAQYRASGAPGGRMPSYWLDAQTSVHDLLGPGLTLVSLDSSLDATPWTDAARARGVPLAVVHLHRPDLESILGATHLLVRPDAIIAWRGGCTPADIGAVLDRVRGATPSPLTP